MLGWLVYWLAVAISIVPLVVFTCKAKNSPKRTTKVALRENKPKQLLKHVVTNHRLQKTQKGAQTPEIVRKLTDKDNTKLETIQKVEPTQAPENVPNICAQNEVDDNPIEKCVQEKVNKYSLVGALNSKTSNSSDMSTDDTLMIEPIGIVSCGRAMAVIEGEQPSKFPPPHTNFSSSSEFAYLDYDESKRDMKEQLLRLQQLNKPAALRAAADLCETIISPSPSHNKTSQTILMRGEKRVEKELYEEDEQLFTAIES